jgi:hypothetical protein
MAPYFAELLRMLYDVRRLIADQGWTAGALARDRDDSPVHPLHNHAERFCLLGAVGRVAWKTDLPELREARYTSLVQVLEDVEPSLAVRGLAGMNDVEGQLTVLRIVDRAIGVLQDRMSRND